MILIRSNVQGYGGRGTSLSADRSSAASLAVPAVICGDGADTGATDDAITNSGWINPVLIRNGTLGQAIRLRRCPPPRPSRPDAQAADDKCSRRPMCAQHCRTSGAHRGDIRTRGIVERLRDFVKKRDVQMRAEKLSQVIEEAIALTRASVRDGGLRFTVKTEYPGVQVEIDKVQVQLASQPATEQHRGDAGPAKA